VRVLCNNFNRRTEGGRIPLARPARSIDRAHIPLALKARPFASQSVTATTFAALRLLPQFQLVSFDSLGSHLANRYPCGSPSMALCPHRRHSAFRFPNTSSFSLYTFHFPRSAFRTSSFVLYTFHFSAPFCLLASDPIPPIARWTLNVERLLRFRQ